MQRYRDNRIGTSGFNSRGDNGRKGRPELSQINHPLPVTSSVRGPADEMAAVELILLLVMMMMVMDRGKVVGWHVARQAKHVPGMTGG